MRSKLQGQEQQRSKFLPMLCSSLSSTKEVKLSHRRSSSSSSSTSTFSVAVSVSGDPSSPRVGCMGQVKKTSKVVGFPNIISFTTTSSSGPNTLETDHHRTTNNIVKYHKLRSFFSSRNLTSSPTTTTTAVRNGTHKGKNVGNRTFRVDSHHGSTSRICRSMADENNNNNNMNDNNASDDQKDGRMVNLEELDPPLPVVKQMKKQEEEGSNNNGEKMNLWKRRSGGAPLKSLQLQLQLQSINQSHTILSANTV